MRPHGGAAWFQPDDPRLDDHPPKGPAAARLSQRGDRFLAAAAARQAARRDPAGRRRPLVPDAAQNVPDWIKNQPLNIKAMPDAVTHWRMEHKVGDLARFNPAQRYWYGTPAWSKVATGAAVGHPVAAAKARSDRR